MLCDREEGLHVGYGHHLEEMQHRINAGQFGSNFWCYRICSGLHLGVPMALEGKFRGELKTRCEIDACVRALPHRVHRVDDRWTSDLSPTGSELCLFAARLDNIKCAVDRVEAYPGFRIVRAV